jgi:hypothetical protein
MEEGFIFPKGFVQPCPTRGEMCILMKTGFPQPDLTRYKWKRDFIFPKVSSSLALQRVK